MNFKDKLYYILEELNLHKRNKADVFQEAVEIRLKDALTSYDKELSNSYDYLCHHNSLNILRKLNKRNN